MSYTEKLTIAQLNNSRDTDGSLPAHAFPGGYPLVYTLSIGRGEAANLCQPCATTAERITHLAGAFIHFEGPPMQCDMCHALVQSAYGNPNSDHPDEPTGQLINGMEY